MSKPLTLGDLKAAIAQAEKEGATRETPIRHDLYGRDKGILYYQDKKKTAYLTIL